MHPIMGHLLYRSSKTESANTRQQETALSVFGPAFLLLGNTNRRRAVSRLSSWRNPEPAASVFSPRSSRFLVFLRLWAHPSYCCTASSLLSVCYSVPSVSRLQPEPGSHLAQVTVQISANTRLCRYISCPCARMCCTHMCTFCMHSCRGCGLFLELQY